jgi:predicted HTH domain antitoxin
MLRIDLPDDLRSVLSLNERELTHLALEALIVRLYERGELSSGKAAEILHISRREFLQTLDQYGVSPFDEGTDFAEEMQGGRI